ncbi:hypothetical protein FRC07_000169 [Ceratobasidium sp. 392]|nr:hypothetical protein FRC07_000169 [Ceratobasidium sp. 392]
MSLSAAQIEKQEATLSKLLNKWVEENPDNKPTAHQPSDTRLAVSERKNGEESKQVVLVALRTRPFLDNETADGKHPLSGVHARGTSMVVHVPASKTYTISSLEETIARDIFLAAKSYAESHFPNSPKPAEDVYTFGLSLYEMLGNNVSDLLDRDEAGNGGSVDVAEDKFGDIRVSAKIVPVSNSQELASMIMSASGHRRTSATLRNETSSRSHCVLTITVKNTLVPSAEPGRLVLVDLAGSERAADRSAHTKDRMDEARLINTSLMTLKDCVRGRALVEAERSKKGDGKTGFQHIPYRSSKLTLALKPVFDVEATRNCKTVVIAHVSPHLVDAPHSNNTLTYVSPFRVVSKTSTKIDPAKLAPFESGKQMCELEETVFIQRCLDSQKDGLFGTDKALTAKGAKAFYDKLWGIISAAKQSTRPETKLEYNPPSVWSNFQARDYVEKELPAIDIEKFCPSMGANPRRGRDFVWDMGEAEFIILATSSVKEGETVTVEDAKGLHTKMWKLENDTWNAERKTILAQRQDENIGMTIDDELLEKLLDHPAVYGTGAEAHVRQEEALRVIQAARVEREAKLQRKREISEQRNRGQDESGN